MKNEKNTALESFFQRRRNFDEYIQQMKLNIFTCPCCGYPTLKRRNLLDFCSVCLWEDDGQDNGDAEKVKGGPNGNISLTNARIAIGLNLKEIEDINKKKLNNNYIQVIDALKKRGEILEKIKLKLISANTKSDSADWREYKNAQEETKKLLLH